MILTALVLAPLQFQPARVAFVVDSINATGAATRKGTSTYFAMTTPKGERNVVWSYKSASGDVAWRREWSYAPGGELTFQSYDVAFGETKTRWAIAKESGAWTLLTGPAGKTPPPRKLSIRDESNFWFFDKKVKVGTEVRIAALEPSNWTARPGFARYLRDETLTIGGKPTPCHVLEKRFGDEIETYYLQDSGAPVRIDAVFPNASSNVRYSLEADSPASAMRNTPSTGRLPSETSKRTSRR